MESIQLAHDTDMAHYEEQWKWCEIAELRRQLKWRDLEIKCLKSEIKRLEGRLKSEDQENWSIKEWRQDWIF